MSETTIFLLTCFPWDSRTGGGYIIRHYVERLSSERIHWFALSHPSGHVPFDARYVSKECVSAPAWGNVRFRLAGFWRWYERVLWAPRVAARINQRLRELTPRVVWIVGDYGLSTVGLRLIPTLKRRRVHVSLHDHLVSAAETNGYCRAELKRVEKFQNSLVHLGPTVDGISEELIDAILPNAKRRAVIALPAASNGSMPGLSGPSTKGTLRIGLSGNFYGQAELACFVEGIRRWSSTAGRDWRIMVYGTAPTIAADDHIDICGVRPADEVLAELAKCDVLLLPMPVESDSIQMRTSVPTKLTTYLEAGRLIFTFAPEKAVTARLIEEKRLGPVVTRLCPEAVTRELERLFDWNLSCANAGRDHLLMHRYDEKRMLEDLAGLLAD